MDPVTAALNLITAIISLHEKTMEAMSPEQRQQYAGMMLEDMRAWRDFLKVFTPRHP